MAQFTFKTQNIPQVKGISGAHWEKLPLSSIPPSFDLSIPGSTANAVAAAMSNVSGSVDSLHQNLKNMTQSLQDLSCSISSFVDNLKGAQALAENFAKQNNNTRVYVRQIGLDPVGDINSYSSFIQQARNALLDTGADIDFKVPKITAAEIPLDHKAIADALGSNSSDTEKLLGGGTNTLLQKRLGVTIGVGLNLPKLSNVINFQPLNRGGGFPTSSISYGILSIDKVDSQTVEITINTSSTFTATQIVIQGTSKNNGTFTIVAGSIKKSSSSSLAISLKYININGRTEIPVPQGTAQFAVEGNITAADKIKNALEQAGYINQTRASKTILATELLKVLLDYNVLNTNQDVSTLELDKSIALERLSKLLTGKTQVLGGIVLVGKAPNIASLVRKVQVLSTTMEWLKPLSERLATSILAQAVEPNPSGIDFDSTNVNLSKLNADNNIGKRDAQAALKKINDSGAQQFELPTLQIEGDLQPPPGQFNIWRKYTPVQLIPGMTSLGQLDSKWTGYLESTTAATVAATTGTLGNLIGAGQAKLDTFVNELNQGSTLIDRAVGEVNALSDQLVQGLNFLKNLTGAGPTTLEGHLVGQNLNLQSNEQFVRSIEQALNDYTDPNRPTFGPSPSPNTFDTQNQLKAALQGGVAPANNTTVWFGLLIMIVGKDREDLGDQMYTIANLLNMDTSSIAIPPKLKIPSGSLADDIQKGFSKI